MKKVILLMIVFIFIVVSYCFAWKPAAIDEALANGETSAQIVVPKNLPANYPWELGVDFNGAAAGTITLQRYWNDEWHTVELFTSDTEGQLYINRREMPYRFSYSGTGTVDVFLGY